jgi:hypothetical protein
VPTEATSLELLSKAPPSRAAKAGAIAGTETDVKRLLLVIALAWVPVAALSGSPEGQRVWFKFNKAFINAHYADGVAFGTIKAQTWGAAKDPHSTRCGGIDGELHVGALEGGVTVPTSQSPISGKAFADDSSWGCVRAARRQSRQRSRDSHKASGQTGYV